MRYILILISLLIIIESCNNKNALENKMSDQSAKDSFYLVKPIDNFTGYGLNAVINGITYKVIDTSEHLFIQKEKEMDFDNDSTLDVLISYSESGGGNCCGFEYFVVSGFYNSKFKRSKMTNNSFSEPIIEKWKGQWSIIITTTNAGVNNDDFLEKTTRYILKNGELLEVEETKAIEIKAVSEIRAKEFSFDNINQEKYLLFDLNNDNKVDSIICSFYDRWGSIQWKIKLSNGNLIESNVSCKRLGVLESKTKKYNDLVTDANDILKWNGKDYE